MNHRIGGVHQAVVIARLQPKLWRGQIAAKNPDLRLQVFIELGNGRCSCNACQSRSSASCGSRPRTSRFRSHHAAPADWRRHARRCIRSHRSGISPRCSVRSRLHGIAIFARCLSFPVAGGICSMRGGTRFQRTPFNQRIRPPPQCRNVNVNPILPPVEPRRVIAENLLLLRSQRLRKLLHIVRDKVMLVLQNKRLKQFHQFLHALQVALGLAPAASSSPTAAEPSSR